MKYDYWSGRRLVTGEAPTASNYAWMAVRLFLGFLLVMYFFT